MADKIDSLYTGQPGTTDTLLYTAPAGKPTVIRNIHVANTTGAPATITLGLNAGGALAAANHFYTAVSVAANSFLDWAGWQVVKGGGTIRALQGTASALTVSISGVETQ
jgi:hypothetical protein